MDPADLGLPAKFTSFRPAQEEAIIETSASDVRLTVLNAPTGAGKSVMAVGVAQLLDARYLYITGSKALQNQASGDFSSIGLVDIRGASNYRCIAVDRGGELEGVAPVGTSCAEAPCRAHVECSMKPSREHEYSKGCLYYDQIAKAAKARGVITNYAFHMTSNRFMEEGSLGRRDLVILDEAHTAPDQLTDFMQVILHEDEVGDVLDTGLPPVEDGQASWVAWAQGWNAILTPRIEQLKKEVRESRSSKLLKELKATRNLQQKLEILAAAGTYQRAEGSDPSIAMPGHMSDWVTERIRENGESVVFTPLWPHPYAERYLFAGIKKVILTSATIIPRTAHYLGLERGDYDYRELKNTFHPSRRPVYALMGNNPIRVSKGMSLGEQRMVVNKIDQIIGSRLGRNGIIHTKSYEWAKTIKALSKYGHLMKLPSRLSMSLDVELFKKRGGILISPALVQGYDFPYRECEWQIVAKIPFPYFGSAVHAARSKADKSYSNYVTIMDLIQMCGRGMRAADDMCETFIVDANVGWFMQAAGKQGLVTGWFKAAYKVINQIPPAPERVKAA